MMQNALKVRLRHASWYAVDAGEPDSEISHGKRPQFGDLQTESIQVPWETGTKGRRWRTQDGVPLGMDFAAGLGHFATGRFRLLLLRGRALRDDEFEVLFRYCLTVGNLQEIPDYLAWCLPDAAFFVEVCQARKASSGV